MNKKFKKLSLILLGLISFNFNFSKEYKPIKRDLPNKTLSWQEIEKKNQNAVVQLFVQSAEFNWAEPYRMPEQKQGAGSGFFIDSEGHILTNYHVVNQSRAIHVFIPALGKQIMDAYIVGVFPESDVALLKLSSKSLNKITEKLGTLPYVRLGDSDKLYTTSSVLTMGYPLGQRYIKCTDGKIAGREFIDNFSYFHITAAINPGNSGGPLFDETGKVVGINSAGILQAQNVGYSIPINNIKIFLNNLKSQSLVRKPRLGIITNPTTEEHAKALNNPWPCGVYINNVIEGTNAYKTGIKAEDMLFSINGYTVDQYGDIDANWGSSGKIALEEYLSRLPIDADINIQVYRKSKKIDFKFKFKEPDLYQLRHVYPEFEQKAVDFELIGGICVMQLRGNHFGILPNTSTLSNYKNLESINKQALVITHVIPGSVAQRCDCLHKGQVISEINGKKVENLKDFRDLIKSNLKSGLLNIKTEGKVSTVLSLNKMLKEENNLSKKFQFMITPFTQSLINSKKVN